MSPWEPQAGGNGGSITVPDYLVYVSGGAVIANALTPGLTTYTGSTSDAAAVIQQAVNKIVSSLVGGSILFRQPLTFASQLVLNPNVALMGPAPIGYFDSGVGPFGPVITSTYNGSGIVLTGDSRGSTFPYLANFEIAGSHANGSQNGIEINDTGGTVRDIFMDNVFIDNMGQHGLVLGGTGGTPIKLHATRLYVEICAGNGIDGSSATNANTLDLLDCYLEGNTGFGLVTPTDQFNSKVVGGRISTNAGGGVSIPSSVTQLGIIGTLFDQNGDSTHPQIVCPSAANASARVLIDACNFNSSTVTNHIKLAGSNFVIASIQNCGFYGSSGDAVAWTGRAGNRIFIENCLGYNDVRGKITNYLAGGSPARIGAGGTFSGPSASTTYVVEGTKLMISASGGSGLSITISDPAGNAIQSGLSSFFGLLPPQFQINFGAFTGSPTFIVAVA